MSRTRYKHPSVTAFVLATLVGCGESRVFSLNPGHLDDEASDAADACFIGAEIELLRYSSLCERASTKSLVSEVGDGPEFMAPEVSTLDSPCANAPSPSIGVYVEETSLLFDFREVAAPGEFPRAEFEGYIIDFALGAEHSLLVAATIDHERTTLALDRGDIDYDYDHIEVNFEGIAYRRGDLVKIDFLFANVLLGEQAE